MEGEHPADVAFGEAFQLRQLEKFLLELGQGFAFIGRQYRIEVGDEEFFIDLLSTT